MKKRTKRRSPQKKKSPSKKAPRAKVKVHSKARAKAKTGKKAKPQPKKKVLRKAAKRPKATLVSRQKPKAAAPRKKLPLSRPKKKVVSGRIGGRKKPARPMQSFLTRSLKSPKKPAQRRGRFGLFALKAFRAQKAPRGRASRAAQKQATVRELPVSIPPRPPRVLDRPRVSGIFSVIRGARELLEKELPQGQPETAPETSVAVLPPVSSESVPQPAPEVMAPVAAPVTAELAPVPSRWPAQPAISSGSGLAVAPSGFSAINEVRPPAHRLTTSELLRPQDDLKQSIEGFLLDQRSPHTRRAYGKDLKRFIQFLIVRKQKQNPENPAEKALPAWNEVIDRHLIIAYKESLLSEGLQHTTVDRHLATLRSFFKWLVDDGRIEKSPVEGVRFLNPRKLSTTIGFTDEEVRRVVAVPDRHTRTGAMHHAVLSILFYCGLRRSELCSLRTSNVGMERQFPVLRLRGKGNAERIVAIPPQAWESLQYYLRISRKELGVEQYLFTPIRNNRGGGVLDKPLDPSMVFYIVTRCAKIAGVANRVSPHSCRATAISNARDHQVSDRAIQEFAGWASPDMITRYDKRKNAVENSASLAIRYEAEDEVK